MNYTITINLEDLRKFNEGISAAAEKIGKLNQRLNDEMIASALNAAVHEIDTVTIEAGGWILFTHILRAGNFIGYAQELIRTEFANSMAITANEANHKKERDAARQRTTDLHCIETDIRNAFDSLHAACGNAAKVARLQAGILNTSESFRG